MKFDKKGIVVAGFVAPIVLVTITSILYPLGFVELANMTMIGGCISAIVVIAATLKTCFDADK